MSIAAEHIEAIRARADIVEVIGGHVTLRKAGRRQVGLCPFHQEKTPSFSVAADKNLYHCFGCGVGGDAFDFVMRHDGVDFQTAARTLARRFGVELDPESPQARQARLARERLAEVNRQAGILYVQTLHSPRGRAAQAYLTGRGIRSDTARTWGLGMGPPTAVALEHFAKLEIGSEALIEAGLTSDDGRHLLAAGRLTFPIRDADGHVAGFGGRRLGDDADAPKYVNSRDSLLFKKSSLLFGLFEAMRGIRQSKRAIIVEGYTDVLAAKACGLNEAVAALGTAFTPAHAQTLRRLADVALVLLDADAAGLKASAKATVALLQAGLKVQVAPLPPGEDPDSLHRKQGPRALQQSVARALPAVEFFMQRAFAKTAMSIEERVAAAQGLAPMLGALASGLERELYTQRLADHVGVSPEQLQKHLRTRPPRAAQAPARAPQAALRARESAPPRREKPDDAPPHPGEFPDMAAADASRRGAAPGPGADCDAAASAGDTASDAEWHCLRELLLYPSLRSRFAELADYAPSSHMADLLEALAQACESVSNVIESRVRHPAWRERLLFVTAADHSALDGENARANRTFNDVLTRFKAHHLHAAMREIDKELAVLRNRDDAGDATVELLRRKRELIVKEKELRRVEKTTR